MRYPIYAEADITVESRDVPHDVIVGEIIESSGRAPLAAAVGGRADDRCEPATLAERAHRQRAARRPRL